MSDDRLDHVPDLPALRAAYARFLEGDRVLLTGHSHQAWPDVARDALLRSFDDSARFVDAKWDVAVFPMLERVGAAILDRLGFDAADPIAFGKSSHELVFRLLTCLPVASRPRVVTTTGEFHSLHRQLARFAEEGAEVVWVPAEPRAGLADRLLAAITPGTRMVAFSAVLFEDAYIVPRLEEITARAVEVGAIPLVDAYHAFNVVPIAWGKARSQLFVTAGGYKYAGFGEGLCWLRFPRDTALRPVDTGWFADFAALGAPRSYAVAYGPGGARFSGATFDASPLYRADAVLAHWDRFGLTLARLRAISIRQTRRILALLDEHGLAADVVSAREDDRRAGFVTVRSAEAGAIVERLRARSIVTDARRDRLRLGPAPYLTDAEIDRGVLAAIEELRAR